METSGAPTRVLIVANRTAATPAVIEAVRRRATSSPCSFTLLVPTFSPRLQRLTSAEDREAQDSESEAVLELALPLLADAAASEVEGAIGDADPLTAIQDVLNREDFDEIILSTLPARVSRWLRVDLPSKVQGLGLPVTHVEADTR